MRVSVLPAPEAIGYLCHWLAEAVRDPQPPHGECPELARLEVGDRWQAGIYRRFLALAPAAGVLRARLSDLLGALPAEALRAMFRAYFPEVVRSSRPKVLVRRMVGAICGIVPASQL